MPALALLTHTTTAGVDSAPVVESPASAGRRPGSALRRRAAGPARSWRLWTLAVGFHLVPVAHAQSSGIRTYCNPIDVGYRYNFEQREQGISYRSGADPVIVNHRGE